ncbi:unnamed protein product, partial [Ascophyllum nodosum]
MPRCGVKECRGRGIAPNLSGKDTIGDASPIGSKHKTVHSPPAQASPLSGGWSTSGIRGAQRKAAAGSRRSEWQVRKRRSTAHSTHRTGWSTSGLGSAQRKAAARPRRSEWQVRKR